jgi:hypothetical protein
VIERRLLMDHPGPQPVRLDVHDEQVRVILDGGALESALPDVPRGSVTLVISPGMCHGQRLEDATDRLPGLRAQEEVEVIGNQAIAEEAEG